MLFLLALLTGAPEYLRILFVLFALSVRCESPEADRQFVSGEEVRVTDAPQLKSSDVVFVVEERMCLQNKKQEIEKIAHQIASKDR